MDDKKIINTVKEENKSGNEIKGPESRFCLHTNPLLKKKFIANIINSKKKFSLKDLFR